MSVKRLSSLNLLRTFESAARLQSFKLAAEELHITSSAVSQQIRDLESQLDVKLFNRQGQGLVLSEAGRHYWQDINPLLLAITRSTEALRQRYSCTMLRVSLMPPVANNVVFPHLHDFQQAHPDIKLRLDVTLANADLLHSSVDLAIRFGEPPWQGCEHRKLLAVSIQPVCPAAINKAFDLTGHPLNLRHAPLIHMTSRPQAWPEFFAKTGLGTPSPTDEFYVDDYPAALEAARSLGVALALYPLENPLLEKQLLVAPYPPLGPIGAIYAVCAEGRLQEPAIQSFLDWLTSQLNRLKPSLN